MKNRIKIFEKNNNKNRVKKIGQKHSNFNSIIGLNKGITLVALVVTIIVLIILAGVSINLLLSENGIVKKAKDSQSVQDVAKILEKLELLKGPILIDENSVDLDTYKEKLEDVSEEYKINYIDDIDSNNAYVVLEGKYKYLLTDKKDGNVEIKYEGIVGELILSETSGEFIYPEEKTFIVVKNESGGALSVKSSNNNIATAEISENTVTVKSGTTSGTATITVTSAATDKYGTNKATYEATVNNGTISISATAYTGNYDGAEHDALTSISTTPTGTTIKYKLKVGSIETDCGTTIPKVTGANTYTVSITASKAGYETTTKSVTVTVGQKNVSGLTITLGTTSYIYDGTAKEPTVTVTDGSKTLTKGTDYTVAYSNNVNVGTATVTITGKGNYTGTKNAEYEINGELLANKVSIGDYVAYNALAYDENNKVYSYTSETGTGSSHGSGYSSSQTFTTNSDVKWRVLSKDTSTGEVVLISEAPIQTDAGAYFYLNGARGYLYAEEELNRICAIYGHGTGANTSKKFTCQNGDTVEGLSTVTLTGSGARSINVDDINNITGYKPTTGSSYTKSIYYPTKKTNDGKSTSAVSRKDISTNYDYAGSSYLTSTEEPYKMLFRDIADANNISYWLASRCVYSISSSSYFCARRVRNGRVNFYNFFQGISSNFSEGSNSNGVRPIVYLKSTVQTSGKNSSGAWTIIDK